MSLARHRAPSSRRQIYSRRVATVVISKPTYVPDTLCSQFCPSTAVPFNIYPTAGMQVPPLNKEEMNPSIKLSPFHSSVGFIVLEQALAACPVRGHTPYHFPFALERNSNNTHRVIQVCTEPRPFSGRPQITHTLYRKARLIRTLFCQFTHPTGKKQPPLAYSAFQVTCSLGSGSVRLIRFIRLPKV